MRPAAAPSRGHGLEEFPLDLNRLRLDPKFLLGEERSRSAGSVPGARSAVWDL